MNASGVVSAKRQPTLVIGGNGMSGRRVAQRLWESGWPIRIGSASAESPFAWRDRASWAPALRGAGAVYLDDYPDPAAPGTAQALAAFVQQAIACGVRRLVMTSARGERGARDCEDALRRSAVDWTILRTSWLSQTFSEGFLAGAVRGGEVALLAGGAPEPFVDADDIAEVAVAALTGQGHAGRLYELTGPRLLSFPEAVAEIAAATCRPIRFRRIPAEQFAARLARQGAPAERIGRLASRFADEADGRNAYLSNGVRRVLSREPRDFADCARDAVARGVWHGEGRRAPRCPTVGFSEAALSLV